MGNQEFQAEPARPADPVPPSAGGAGADATLKTRRQLLKAGLVAAPLVLTFRARPVLGQIGQNVSGLSGASRQTE